MKRLVTPPEIPKLPQAKTAPLDLSIEVRSITPIVGGGVDKHEPDTLDGVRVPGIRGQLRAWLRLLVSSSLNSKAVFQTETRLFGRGGADEGEGGKSQVALWIEGDRAARTRDIEPAGFHPLKPNGEDYKSPPKWNVDERLGYGLFPLQLEQKYLKGQVSSGKRQIDTHDIKKSCSFTLRIRALPHARKETLPAEDVELLLLSLWAFLTFGGLGGRTSRGFGALGVEKVTGEGQGSAWPQDPLFRGLLQKPKDENDARARLKTVWRKLRELQAPLGSATLLLGGGGATATTHAELLGFLRDFRQREDLGRGQGKRGPGMSFWPEPMALRRIYGVGTIGHRPPPDLRADRLSFPRAAFGLPLELKFKASDKEDARADSKLLPPKGGRWPSPVRLRPLACANQKAVPLVLILRERPKVVIIKSRPTEGSYPVAYQGQGASHQRGSIGDYLRKDEDGVDAFEAWLKTKGYQPLGGGK